MNEPKTFISGDTVTWKEQAGYVGTVYYSAPSWILSYELRGQNKITITASQDATSPNFLISFIAATSDGYTPGIYAYQAYVTKSPDRYTLWSGRIEILINLAEQQDAYQSLDHVRLVLLRIETAIENYALNPYQKITIAGRSKDNWKLDELIAARAKYRGYLARLIQEENIAKGLPAGGRILATFSKWS